MVDAILDFAEIDTAAAQKIIKDHGANTARELKPEQYQSVLDAVAKAKGAKSAAASLI